MSEVVCLVVGMEIGSDYLVMLSFCLLKLKDGGGFRSETSVKRAEIGRAHV